MKARLVDVGSGLVLPVGLLALWWFASEDSTSPYFPPLRQITDVFVHTWFFDRFASDLIPSIAHFVVGFAVASAFGVAVGLWLGLSPRARRDVSPITEYLRATPIAALVPVGVVIVGPGATMEVGLIAFGACWPILLNTTDGVRGTDPLQLETARVYGLTPWQRIVRVTMPAALPQIFAGFRVAVPLGIVIMIIVNMYASTSGVGFYVIDAQASFNIRGIWAGLFIIGLVGVMANFALMAIQSRVLAWHRGWRASAKDIP